MTRVDTEHDNINSLLIFRIITQLKYAINLQALFAPAEKSQTLKIVLFYTFVLRLLTKFVLEGAVSAPIFKL